MIGDWLRSRRQLVADLVGVREQWAAAVEERNQSVGALMAERAAHDATQRVLEQMEAASTGDVFWPVSARTPTQELASMKAHVTELEQRLHVLQQANMAADQR